MALIEMVDLVCVKCGRRCEFKVPSGVTVSAARCVQNIKSMRLDALCADPEMHDMTCCMQCPNIGPTPAGYGMMCGITGRCVE